MRRRLSVERLESRLVYAVSGLDPDFGTGGQVVDPFVESTSEGRNVRDIEILSDGKILAAGDGTIDRYLPDGKPDPRSVFKGERAHRFTFGDSMFNPMARSWWPVVSSGMERISTSRVIS